MEIYNPPSAITSAAIAAALNGTVSQIVLSTLVTGPALVPGVDIVAVGTNDAQVGYRYVSVPYGAGNAPATAAMGSPFNGNTTLGASNKNKIIPPAVAGAIRFDIYRTGGVASGNAYIGTCLPGGFVLDDGTVVAANPQTVAPAVDGGSAGTSMTGPLVVQFAGYAAALFGTAQFGSTSIYPRAIDAPGATGINVVMTGDPAHPGSNNLLMQDPGGSRVVFRTNAGTLQNPTPQDGGAGGIYAENFVTGKNNKTSAYIEIGASSTGSLPDLAHLVGRVQLAPATGMSRGMDDGTPGIYVAALYPLMGSTLANPVGAYYGAAVDHWQYRSGFDLIGGAVSATNYEAFYAGWAPVSNALTGVSWSAGSGGQVTALTTTPHGVSVGQVFTLSGISASGYNSMYVAVTGTTGSTLVGQLASNPGAGSGGAAYYPGTVFNDGPVALGTGTLRGRRLTGAAVTADGPFNYGGLATGLVNVMAATATPAVLAYKVGAFYIWQANITNTTTTPTIAFNGLSALTIVKRAATALAAGDYLANMMCFGIYDGTNMELLNPVVN